MHHFLYLPRSFLFPLILFSISFWPFHYSAHIFVRFCIHPHLRTLFKKLLPSFLSIYSDGLNFNNIPVEYYGRRIQLVTFLSSSPISHLFIHLSSPHTLLRRISLSLFIPRLLLNFLYPLFLSWNPPGDSRISTFYYPVLFPTTTQFLPVCRRLLLLILLSNQLHFVQRLWITRNK